MFDSLRPVMRQTEIHLGAKLKELSHIEFANVIDRVNVVPIVRETLEVRLPIIVPFPDS
jgi:hypothetical protein